MVAITQIDCTGCDLCINHCPFEALLPLKNVPIGMRKRPVIVVETECVGCLSCIGSCPTNALHEKMMPENAVESPLMSPSASPETDSILRWGKNGIGWP